MKSLAITILIVLLSITGCTSQSCHVLSRKSVKCEPWPHPLAKQWTRYDCWKCIQKYLQKERIQKISFCWTWKPSEESPDKWWCNEIVEQKKINEVVKLLDEAVKKESDKFANDTIAEWSFYSMQIITNRHKFIIPIDYCDQGKAICGVGWKSCELIKKLKQWSPQSKDANQPK